MKSLLAALLATVSLLGQAAVVPLDGVTPQRATALATFPMPVAVRVTDESGRPVAGAGVYLNQPATIQPASAGNTTCSIEFMVALSCKAFSDSEGIARFPAMRPTNAGSFTAMVSADNDKYPGTIRYGETSLQFTVDPIQTPARLVITEGNNQRVVIGSVLTQIVARVENPQGQPVVQARLWYSPYGSPGGFDLPASGPAEVHTDDHGIAALPRFTAGWALGEHEAQVRYFDEAAAAHVIATVKYTATNPQGGMSLELGDLWWGGPSESGWGLSINQREARLFNVWFVYDDASRPTWFVQPGGAWSDGVGAYFSGSVYSPRSSPWFAYDASRLVAGPAMGGGSVNFNGPQAAWTGFNSVATYRSWYKHVERQVFGGNDAGPLPGVGGLWWGGPSQNGWGLAVHEQGSKLFLAWFTYDSDGMPTWFVMPDGAWSDQRTHAGAVYRTSGTPWSSLAPFDPASVHVTTVGSYRLSFESKDSAQLDVNVDGRSVSVGIVRQVF